MFRSAFTLISLTSLLILTLLLADTTSAANGMTSPQQFGSVTLGFFQAAPKETKPGYPRVGTHLAQLYHEYKDYQDQGGGDQFEPSNPLVRVSGGAGEEYRVIVDAVASGDPATLRANLVENGLLVTSTFKRTISGWLPLSAIHYMPGVDGLNFIRTSVAVTAVGSVESQGDAALNADDARTNFGIDGSGITVGAMSDSFDTLGGAAGDVASGDLPAGIIVLADTCSPTPCTDEGRALMQLIADVAPGADQSFHTAFGGAASFALGIQELAGCPPGSGVGCVPSPDPAEVIVDDVGYLAQPFFQDGIIAQAVDVVKAAGIAYFSSAGNDDRASYESPFRSSGVAGRLAGQTLHDFDPGGGVDTCQSVSIPTGTTVFSLQWDQPFFSVSGAPGSANDLDIHLFFNSTCTIFLQMVWTVTSVRTQSSSPVSPTSDHRLLWDYKLPNSTLLPRGEPIPPQTRS